MTGTDDQDLVYTPGTERIPDNWYTFAAEDGYDGVKFITDFAKLVQQHPEFIAFGWNTGTVNSFTGLNIANLTVSTSNLSIKTLINAICYFIFQHHTPLTR